MIEEPARAAADTLEHREAVRLGRVHVLLSIQSVLLALGSLNRLGEWTLAPIPGLPGIRWRELLNLLVLPPAGLLVAWLVVRRLRSGSAVRHGTRSRADLAVDLLLLAGGYLTGVGYGVHEITNHLGGWSGLPPDLLRILRFQDDDFSHWVFFAGFMMINGAVMLGQAVHPWAGACRMRDRLLLAANGAVIAAGIVANLAFQPLGLDLYIVAAMAVLALVLCARAGFQPLLLYYVAAFVPGLIVTVLIKALRT